MFVVQLRSSVARLGARHRRLRPALVLAAAMLAGWVVADRVQALDQARRAWDSTVTVWITADATIRTDGSIAARPVEVPRALVPDGAVAVDPSGTVATRPLGAGRIITSDDLAVDRWPGDGRRGVSVPTDESSLPLTVGAVVDVVSSGVVLAADGVVMAVEASATVVAVPADAAPAVAAAALERTASLVLVRSA